MTSFVVIAAVSVAVIVLTRPELRAATAWRATITPLASIIGSGFLVVAPLLVGVVGSWAPVAMGAIVVFAYSVGAVIRFNIRHVEPLLGGDAPNGLQDVERLSEIALGFAYVISVAFYLQLLAVFALEPMGLSSPQIPRLLASAVVAGIGAVGWLRGLDGLEVLEEIAVSAKLSVIAGLLAGTLWFDVQHFGDAIDAISRNAATADGWTVVRTLAGMLLVVQGFETSRYLGHHYAPGMRTRSMRLAQVLSGLIYVVFVALVTPLGDAFPAEVSETAILDAARVVSPVLAPMIILAAIASQFSAAVADTAGGGGMLAGASSRVRPRSGYAAVAVGALVVIWSTNVFGIIALASRAFALYYLTQTVSAYLATRSARLDHPGRTRAGLVLVGASLAFVVVFGIPAG